MIVTVAIVTTDLLWPTMKPITDIIDKALILVRVVLTVIYGHVVHTLRRASAAQQPLAQQVHQQLDELRRLHTATIEQHQREIAAQREQERVAALAHTQQSNDIEVLRATLDEREQRIEVMQHQYDGLLSMVARVQKQEQKREAHTIVSEAKPERERHTDRQRAIPASTSTSTVDTSAIREQVRAIHLAEPTLSSRRIEERIEKAVSHATIAKWIKEMDEEEIREPEKESEA